MAERVWSTLAAMRTCSSALLERGDVARSDVHHRVGLAGDGRGVDDLGDGREDPRRSSGATVPRQNSSTYASVASPVEVGVDLDGEATG